LDHFQTEILELIAAHDGRYSWYQLDRALSTWSADRERNLPLLRGLPEVLRELEDDGLISSGAGHHPSQPVYSITAQGEQAIGAPAAVSSLDKNRGTAADRPEPSRNPKTR
jgi:hypothetical protein